MLEQGLDEQDAVEVLRKLKTADSTGRLRSERTREWLYVFKPAVAGTRLYVKVLLRNECFVVSFHEDSDDEKEETDEHDAPKEH